MYRISTSLILSLSQDYATLPRLPQEEVLVLEPEPGLVGDLEPGLEPHPQVQLALALEPEPRARLALPEEEPQEPGDGQRARLAAQYQPDVQTAMEPVLGSPGG